MPKVATNILYHVRIVKVKIFISLSITGKHKYMAANSAVDHNLSKNEGMMWEYPPEFEHGGNGPTDGVS